MNANLPAVDYVACNLVIDDVVYPDGKTRMGRLGGGGPQAAYGMRLGSTRVGLSGSVGRDFPQSLRAELDVIGVDLGGVREHPSPTPRAWQILEEDGRRTQVWRVGQASLAQHLKRSISDLPEAYKKARGFHLGIHPLDPDLEFLEELHALGGLVSVETYKPAERPLRPDELRALLKPADIISMNAAEAESLLGKRKWEEQLALLFAAGARLVTLRWDKGGCLAAEERQVIHLPALAAAAGSPLGAGNAFCGGFLGAWVESRDLAVAACRATAAAALFLSQGYVLPQDPSIIHEHIKKLTAQVERWR